MKRTVINIGLLGSMLLFTGCGFKQPSILPHMDKETPSFRLESGIALTKGKSAEEEAACSIHLYLHSAARVTLENGYNYFAIKDNSRNVGYESNLNGLAINSSEAYMRYCNPALKNSDTGLEDDKCQFHYLGYDISKKWGGQILMMKQRTYLFPTWDAKKVMREEGEKANACIDWSQYSEANSIRDAKIKY